ncbi:helix-turn-helix domain-containing protein [Kitasatospora cineracea]|uniref:helix-turn-helix domain-containing protein n=1 Tax=Kitasatospora cineracea TaxID=88074 RepID=UPI0033F42FF3
MTTPQRPGGIRPLGLARPQAASPALPQRYLSPEDVATLFGAPQETVYQWRRKHTGPPGFRVGKHLRYDPNAVAQWVAGQTREAA